MKHIFRTMITIVAAFAVVFSGVAVAQDDDQVAECEARGGEWFDWGPGAPQGCSLDHPEEYGKVLELRALVAQRDECVAQGGSFMVNPAGWFCEIDGTTHAVSGGDPEPTEEPAQVESATAEPAPSAPLPKTETAPASQTAPTFTG